MSKEKPKTTVASSKPLFNQQGEKATFAFGKENYKMMLIGIAVVASGMLCMIGGASDDPTKMSTTIFDTQRTIIAPILIVAGFVVVLLSIIKKPKE